MPIFEFTCLECGKEFECLVMKSSESNEVKCPACSSSKLEEKLSSFASVAEGGGSGLSNCTPIGG
ncbi:MAG: zinc ribbon domain-containing protein [Acidobacteriota bacterium]